MTETSEYAVTAMTSAAALTENVIAAMTSAAARTENVDMPVTSTANASDASASAPEASAPALWQLNFFSFFIEHPAMRHRPSVYVTFRMATLALLLPAGLLGNALTVAVMRRPRMRKQAVSLTLSVLAVCDACCLLIRGLLWVNLVCASWGLPLPVTFHSDAACR